MVGDDDSESTAPEQPLPLPLPDEDPWTPLPARRVLRGPGFRTAPLREPPNRTEPDAPGDS